MIALFGFMEWLFKRKFYFSNWKFIHWTINVSPFFFILLPCLHPFHLSPYGKISPWEKILNSLFFICHINFIVLCLFAFDSMVVAFWNIFSPFKFIYASFNVRILNFKCINTCNPHSYQDRGYFHYFGRVLSYRFTVSVSLPWNNWSSDFCHYRLGLPVLGLHIQRIKLCNLWKRRVPWLTFINCKFWDTVHSELRWGR